MRARLRVWLTCFWYGHDRWSPGIGEVRCHRCPYVNYPWV